ncbi:MAG: protoheme IX farnesyltransferase [Parvularcula sp.]|jgi:hypothetical protein|nr:protoheme IX farnesyltransferase [Parvularcula sp.]
MDEQRRVNPAEAREGLPTGETHKPSEAETKARGRRNIAIALAVVGFVVLVYLTTFLRLAENIKTVPSVVG